MNTYTFTYYGWIPGYNDFDQDWFDVKANSLADAKEQVKKMKLFIKGSGEPGLDAVNEIQCKNLTAEQIIEFKL